MNYTKNYRLPQWVKEDRIMMDDFNAAMASMESGMTSTAAQVNAANTKADAAVQTANAAAAARPYVVGSYTGNGEPKIINLGFRPSFLIISGMEPYIQEAVGLLNAFNAMTAGSNKLNRYVTFTDTGFEVTQAVGNSYPKLSDPGQKYDYIAFK